MKKLIVSKQRKVALLSLAIGSMVLAASSLAQDENAIASDLQVCSTLKIAAAKEACYDNLAKHAADQHKQEAAKKAAQAAPKPKVEAKKTVASKPVEKNIEKPVIAAPKIEMPAVVQSDSKSKPTASFSSSSEETIEGTINSLRKPSQQNRFSNITLDNGQIWRQTQSKMFHLKEGDKVRLEGVMGSTYRLYKVGSNGFIRVKRFR